MLQAMAPAMAASMSVLARWDIVKEDEAGVNVLRVEMGFAPLKAGDAQRKDEK